MTHLDLLKRIENLDVAKIEKMSTDGMVMVSDSFDESLTRDLVMRGKTNREQRRTFAAVKEAYKDWKEGNDAMWHYFQVYPQWMNEMQLDIECGLVLTTEGSEPEPEEDTLGALYPPSLIKKLQRATEDAIRGTEPTAAAAKDDSHIRELETENRRLKEELDERGAEVEQFRTENEQLKERIKEILETKQGEDDEQGKEKLDFLEDWQKLTAREFAIFFSQALGVSFNPEFINQQQLANLAAKWTEPKPETIRAKIGSLLKEETEVGKELRDGFSPKTKDEALNVYYFIIRVAKYYSCITRKMQEMLDGINQVYCLNIDEDMKKKISDMIDDERTSGKKGGS